MMKDLDPLTPLSRRPSHAPSAWLAAICTLMVAACGGSGPTSGTAVTGGASSSGADLTLTGLVVGTMSGQPVAGARVGVGGSSAVSDADGQFRVTVPNAGIVSLSVEAAGHVSRRTFVRVDGPAPVIDIIETGTLWNLAFYRELCRDGAGGGTLKPLKRWTMDPRFYIDRRPERGRDRPIPDPAVETVREAIATVLPLLSRGRLRGDRIELGTDPPPDMTTGTVIIRWDPIEVSQVAGAAAGFTRGVGGDASVVVLRTIEETEAIFHELGHVLGLYHPLGGVRPSLLLGPGTPERPHFTQWDVFHANVLYSRPTGNTDVDNDPQGFVINEGGVGP